MRLGEPQRSASIAGSHYLVIRLGKGVRCPPCTCLHQLKALDRPSAMPKSPRAAARSSRADVDGRQWDGCDAVGAKAGSCRETRYRSFALWECIRPVQARLGGTSITLTRTGTAGATSVRLHGGGGWQRIMLYYSRSVEQ